MNESLFDPFRLVGGTSLSLQFGHRKSIDIDLFTQHEYGSIDFDSIHSFISKNFPYCDSLESPVIGVGKSYFIGKESNDSIKLDVYYTDTFIRDYRIVDGIRLARPEDVIAMKLEVIQNKGRKKDFWDINELFDYFALNDMVQYHKERYPYSLNKLHIINQLIQFDEAENDFDPICLRNKHWELIKIDIAQEVENLR